MIAHPVNDGEGMTPTPESMKVARDIVDQYRRENMGSNSIPLEKRKQNLIDHIALALDLAVRKAKEAPCKKCGHKPDDGLS